MNRSLHGAIAGLALLGVVGASQAADPYPAAAYPQQYPQQYPQPNQPSPMRSMFAATVASMAQTTGSAAIVAVADGLTGALKNWFDNRRQRKGTNGALGANYYPAPASMTGGMPMSPQSYPPPPPAGNYPQPADPNAYPQPGDPNAYPQSNDTPWNTGGSGGSQPASNVGYPDTNNANYSNYPPTPPPAQLYAGIAYEIHLLQPDGSTAPVDIASYSFRTGDQFRVYYRPSLPGRVDVFNINPAGQQSQIDTSNVASGQLASLGPYQFTDLQGDETLILKLTPCMTPTLYATTRNIVKVQDARPTYPTNNSDPMGMGDCSSTSTRGLRTKTRDIRKVTVEGGTSFALDPIAPTEFGAGDVSPRQVTITLHHR